MKYYIIAGEASGDLHGSNLIREIHQLDGNAVIRCWGGEKMEGAGATLVKHYRDLAFMGFIEVVKNLPTIFRNLAFCKKDISGFKPDALILIDYPGFNLRIAEWARKEGLKIIYYISPQVWAWKENRVKKIKRDVDKMLVILPFEKEFYKHWGMEVEYVGHPLVEVIDAFRKNKNTDHSPDLRVMDEHGNRIIALLPGSRRQEILIKLPIMLKVAEHFPSYRFIVAKAPGLTATFYDELLQPFPHIGAVENRTYELLNSAAAALVTSGTATLETALFAVPEIICYKGSNVSYQIARRLIKIKYIGLVNLIMDKEVVKELIQDELTVNNIVSELKKLLEDPVRKKELEQDYHDLKELLGRGGHASANAAKSIWAYLMKPD